MNNIEHSTSNIEHPITFGWINGWMFDVRCSLLDVFPL